MARNQKRETPFERCKRAAMAENERRYGAEVRERFGDAAMDASARHMLGMTEADHARWAELGAEILERVKTAVERGLDPSGTEGASVCALHREWLTFTWPAYSAEAHRGLAEMYVADARFRAYYDRTLAGCAQWLRDAIVAHA